MKRDRKSELQRRLMVRAPDDIWSDEFREQLRSDRRFEGSLLLREAAVLAIVVLVIVVRQLAT